MKKEQQEIQAKKAKEDATAAKKPAPANPESWSHEQQKQLEEGMRQIGANVPTKERWTQIAGLVTDKTPKQCYERFKELCAKAKAK